MPTVSTSMPPPRLPTGRSLPRGAWNGGEPGRRVIAVLIALIASGILPVRGARVADEEVAQWVVTVGGVVTVEAGGKAIQVAEAAQLPAGKYDIISLALPSLAKVSESDLARIGALRRLGYLEIKDAAMLTPGGLAAVTLAAPVSTLIMRNVPLTDADLACLGKVRTLRTLDLRGCPRLTGTVWREWKALNLERLAMQGWQGTGDALGGLGELKSVRHLVIDGFTGLTGDDFARGLRSGVSDIEWVNMPGLSGQVRAALSAFPKAASVRIGGIPLNPSDLTALAQFKPMTFLQLAGTGTGDAQVAEIAKSATIVTLHWFHFATAGTSLDGLAVCKSLRQLALSDSQITDAAMPKLVALTQVERLLLDGNPAVTDAGVAHLASMKQMRTLRLSRTGVTSAALPGLAALRKLEALELAGCPGVSPEAVAVFQKALPKCKIVFP